MRNSYSVCLFELNYCIKGCFHNICKCLPFRKNLIGFHKGQHSERGFQARVVVY